ncbi:MAG: VOC family protein [bacterium]|nr:VOC family protein [bacterium]
MNTHRKAFPFPFLVQTAQMNTLARALMILTAALIGFSPLSAPAVEVDLTRHLAQLQRTSGQPDSYTESFFGVEGEATLTVISGDQSDPHTRARCAFVYLNGELILAPSDFNQQITQIEVPTYLLADNSISVEIRGKPGSQLSVRVNQRQDVNLNIVSRIHFQVNASSFDVSKAFYSNLGFWSWIPFPPTNTLEVAQAVGVDHPYQIRVEVGLMVPSPDGGLFGFPAIDLIQWFDPWRPDPPYGELNHLGMARVALRTTDLDGDMEYLQLMGVNFLTQPAADGTRFAIFTDPDGVYYELVEAAGPPPAVPNATSISGVAHVNVNVSDFGRSREFYRMLGMTGSLGPAYIDTPEVAALLGGSEPLSIQGELIQLPADGSVVELVQWLNPHDPEPAYAPPINHLGIDRMAYYTLDLAGDVERLKAQGVEFLSEIAPCCSGPESTSGIVAFSDPDGTFIELLGEIAPSEQ